MVAVQTKLNTTSRIASIHPFPARMAPEIALESISKLEKTSIVLDPMVGSGTVIHQALIKGHKAIGFDLDPLAVLMSRVATQTFCHDTYLDALDMLLRRAQSKKLRKAELPWIDRDLETREFIDFWFGERQSFELRRIAFVLVRLVVEGLDQNIVEALQLALSRIIVTKTAGASLAWDISHSRPHVAKEKNDYDVFGGYERSARQLLSRLPTKDDAKKGSARIKLGDARSMKSIKSRSVDLVLTSPPYLNAIDYMRGHKLSLVWLGYTINELRGIRSDSIGAQRGRSGEECKEVSSIRKRALRGQTLSSSHERMLDRYVFDALEMMSEVARVMRNDGKAILVVGNSNLRGSYVRNSEVFNRAGAQHGLTLVDSKRRQIPHASRYLPLPKKKETSLGKRMRFEVVQTYRKSA